MNYRNFKGLSPAEAYKIDCFQQKRWAWPFVAHNAEKCEPFSLLMSQLN